MIYPGVRLINGGRGGVAVGSGRSDLATLAFDSGDPVEIEVLVAAHPLLISEIYLSVREDTAGLEVWAIAPDGTERLVGAMPVWAATAGGTVGLHPSARLETGDRLVLRWSGEGAGAILVQGAAIVEVLPSGVPAPAPAPAPVPGPVPVPGPSPVPGPAPGPSPTPDPAPAPSPVPVPVPPPGPGSVAVFLEPMDATEETSLVRSLGVIPGGRTGYSIRLEVSEGLYFEQPVGISLGVEGDPARFGEFGGAWSTEEDGGTGLIALDPALFLVDVAAIATMTMAAPDGAILLRFGWE